MTKVHDWSKPLTVVESVVEDDERTADEVLHGIISDTHLRKLPAKSWTHVVLEELEEGSRDEELEGTTEDDESGVVDDWRGVVVSGVVLIRRVKSWLVGRTKIMMQNTNSR